MIQSINPLFTRRLMDADIITYRVFQYSVDLPLTVIDAAIRASFDVWQNLPEIKATFVQIRDGSPDIPIFFTANDDPNFPPPEQFLPQELALSYSVSNSIYMNDGNVQFRTMGVNDLMTIMIHEIGHVVGLPHLDDVNSAMHKRVTRQKRSLSVSDRQALMTILGSAKDSMMIGTIGVLGAALMGAFLYRKKKKKK